MDPVPLRSQDGKAVLSATSSHTQPSEVFAWTCANDPYLRHLKKLNIGAYSEVHLIGHRDISGTEFIMRSPSGPTDNRIMVFARKLLTPFAFLSENEILNEFRAIQKLCIKSSHENLVAVYHYGKLPESVYYYIDMEYCDLDLQEYIYEFEGRGFSASKNLTPLDTKMMLQIMRDISRGLSFIHEHREIHRDLKPNNNGVWKIGDFGFTMEKMSGATLTSEMRRGTSSYRAPELLREIPAFDESVDIWALGCIFFELVSGQKAFSEDWSVKVYAGQNKKLSVPLEPFVDPPARIPLTNLIHEMLQVRYDLRPHADDIRFLFDVVNEKCSFERQSNQVDALYSRICQTQEDQTYPGSSRSIVFSVPYERNPFFTGREKFLDALFRKLRDKQPYRYNHRIALYGLGGVGKTQTVLDYAYRHREDYAYIFWISGVDRAELISGFSRISRLLRCGLSLTKPEDIAKRVRLWFEANENWLFIIDNLDDIEVVSGYLPQSNGSGHTIITTRNMNTDGIPADGLEVREMDQDSAVSFLLRRIQVVDPSIEIQEEAYKIVNVLGGLPLAIEQAAGYIRVPENIFSYLRIFQSSRRKLLEQRLPGNHIYTRTVATTWKCSFKRLEKTSPNANLLLQYFAFMNPDEISVDYLRTGAAAFPPILQNLINDPFDWGEVICALEELSLIRVSARNTKFSIHRLLQVVIQDGLELVTRCEIEIILLQIGLISFPELCEDLLELETCRQFRSQVAACLEHTRNTQLSPIWIQLAKRVGLFLYFEGLYNEACQWWGNLLSLQRESVGGEHPDTLSCRHRLSCSLERLGRSQDALIMNKDTLAIRIKVLGPEHPDTLLSMNRLAISYNNTGQFKEAAELNTETLNIRKKVLGPEHPDTLWSMNNLAITYDNLGQFREAADLKAEISSIRKRLLGPEHPDTLLSMNNLAVSYNNLGRSKEAADLKAETLNIRKRVLGPEHPDTLRSMNSLAIAYNDLGQFKEAAELITETLNIRKRVLGPEHPDTLRSMSCLAIAYNALGQFNKAAELNTETLNIRKRVMGPEHPDTLESMSNLACSYEILGRFKQAVDLHGETFNLKMRVLGADHPKTLKSRQYLETVKKKLGRSTDITILTTER